MIELTKPTIGSLAYFQIYQKSMEGAFSNNHQHILIGYFLNDNVDLGRVSMHSIVYQNYSKKQRQSLDQGLVFGVLLTDLSKDVFSTNY